MSVELNQFQQSEGFSDAEMADLLTEKLGRTISERGYAIMKNRKATPQAWLEALSIVPHDPSHVQENVPMRDDDKPRTDDRPRITPNDIPDSPRSSRALTPDHLLPFEPATAHASLTLTYQMAGRGAAAVMAADDAEKRQAIASVWAGFAPHIATGYIEWARENETVAKVIGMMTLGGAGGKVVMLHASLLVQTLIVSGDLNPAMMVPPGLRVKTEEGDETSVGDAEYPGGENGKSGRKGTRRQGAASE